MALTVYTGVMGSGKSYEAVRAGIVPALKAGRRVVTNIEGISVENLQAYCKANFSIEVSVDSIVKIDSKAIDAPGFFYKPGCDASVVQPGDLLCLDEVWRFWGDGCKLSDDAMEFVRMHRHYTDSTTGVACDLLLMIQDLSGLHRKIRNVVELNLRFRKLKGIGLPSRFRVEIYEGSKQTKGALVSSTVNKYDTDIFPLYKSYESDGKEVVVDGRANLFNNKLFVSAFALSFVGLCVSSWWLSKKVASWRSPQTASSEQSTAGQPSKHAPALAGAAITMTGSNSRPTCPFEVLGIALVGDRTFAFVREAGTVRQEIFTGVLDGSASLHKGCSLGPVQLGTKK